MAYLYFLAVRQNYSLTFFLPGSTPKQCRAHLQDIRVILKTILVDEQSMGDRGAHMNSILDIMYPRKDPLNTRCKCTLPAFDAIPDGALQSAAQITQEVIFSPAEMEYLLGKGQLLPLVLRGSEVKGVEAAAVSKPTPAGK